MEGEETLQWEPGNSLLSKCQTEKGKLLFNCPPSEPYTRKGKIWFYHVDLHWGTSSFTRLIISKPLFGDQVGTYPNMAVWLSRCELEKELGWGQIKIYNDTMIWYSYENLISPSRQSDPPNLLKGCTGAPVCSTTASSGHDKGHGWYIWYSIACLVVYDKAIIMVWALLKHRVDFYYHGMSIAHA